MCPAPWNVIYSHAIAINSTGYLFVSQWYTDTIAILSPGGAIVKTTDYVGGDIYGLAINSSDFVFVACGNTPTIQVLDRDGTQVESFNSGVGALSSIAVNRTDHLILGPKESGTISVLDKNHHAVGPSITTVFGSVSGLATDAAGNIFAVEYGSPIFRVFSPAGGYIGASSGMTLTAYGGIAVSSSGVVAVTDINDYHLNRVRLFSSPQPVPTSTPAVPSPSFAAYPQSGPAPHLVQFLDYTRNAKSWSWDFGDNGSSTLRYPTHLYNQSGLYSVTLTVTDWSDRTATKTEYHLIRVSDPVTPAPTPVADFSANATVGAAPITVGFTDESSPSPYHRWWQFGDGGSSTDANPVHTFTKAGTYTVNLTVWTSLGTATVSKLAYITVGPDSRAPVANFTMSRSSGTAPLYVRFTDTSTNAASWRWDFGGWAWTTMQSPSVVFRRPGEYAVTLTASNAYGSSTVTRNLSVTGAMPRGASGSPVRVVG